MASSAVPHSSVLHALAGSADFSDTHAGTVPGSGIRRDDVANAFFRSMPAWVDWLFWLRNRLVGIVGLKTGDDRPRDIDPPYVVGRAIGLFRVIEVAEHEVVFGDDDRHLDFRVSMMAVPKPADGDGQPATEIRVSTLVVIRSPLGRWYLAVVKPFHRVIARAVFGRMLRQLRRMA